MGTKKPKKKGGRRKGAGRPSIPVEDKRVRVSHTLLPDLVRQVHDAASQDGVSDSAWIEQAIREWLKKWARTKGKKPDS